MVLVAVAIPGLATRRCRRARRLLVLSGGTGVTMVLVAVAIPGLATRRCRRARRLLAASSKWAGVTIVLVAVAISRRATHGDAPVRADFREFRVRNSFHRCGQVGIRGFRR